MLKANVQKFEGNINFVRQTIFDTTHISIYVKDFMVRIDEYNSKRKLTSSNLINLNTKEIIALSHDSKLYTQINIITPAITNTNGIEIIKTQNHKEINGRKCYQWRVKDGERNTEIAYWVFEDNMDFFDSLILLLNRTEYSFSLFKNIPERTGFFPMLTEERTLLRQEKQKIALVAINEKKLNASLFQIPNGYKALNR